MFVNVHIIRTNRNENVKNIYKLPKTITTFAVKFSMFFKTISEKKVYDNQLYFKSWLIMHVNNNNNNKIFMTW